MKKTQKTKRTKQNGHHPTAGRDVFNAAIEPLIPEVRERRGFSTEIARQFSTLAGSETHRNVIDNWFHPDPSKRVEPAFGNGTMLFQAIDMARKVMDRADQEKKLASLAPEVKRPPVMVKHALKEKRNGT